MVAQPSINKLEAGQAPALASARLRLRPIDERDADAITSLIGDFEVARWLSRVPHPYSREDALGFILNDAPQHVMWVIELPDGQLAGLGGFTFVTRHCEVELGYWLGRPFWGQGIATEAGALMMEHAWRLSTQRIRSGYFEGNTRSSAVLRKLGFSDVQRSTRFNLALGGERAHVDVMAERPPDLPLALQQQS